MRSTRAVDAERARSALRSRARETVMAPADWRAVELPARTDTDPIAEDRRALDHLFSVAYEELRRLASGVRHGDPGATLSPTALVNEAWLKLADSPHVASTSPLHFRRIAARAMRQVLIEAARRRHADKRGGDDAVMVTWDDSLGGATCAADDVLALDAALDELARIHPRQAMMVESRFFGGLDVSETAELLGVSEATVLRDWRAARAWLAVELGRQH
jgi:RNA polymerase sigma factor (TIGR02999 family)